MAVQPLKALNERHHRFVMHYLEDYNASRAAKLAGFSEKSASSYAYQLLQDPLVQDAIKKRQQEITEELNLSLGTILREYKRVAFANLAHVANWDKAGHLQAKTPDDLDPDKLAALCEISNLTIETEGMTKSMQKIKMHPKLAALDKLTRLQGLLDNKDGGEDDGGLASLLEMEKPPDA